MTSNFTVFTSCAGHSAKSPGAAANGYKEHEQARLCNDAFMKAMKAHGRCVIDTTSDGKNKMAVLQEQVAKANKINAGDKQLDISLHLNSSGGRGATGVEVHYYSDSVKKVASDISAAIAEALGIRNRGTRQNKELYFLRHTKAKAILVEVCFIDKESDMRALEKNRQKAMEAMAEVLIGPFFSSTEPSTESTAKSAYTGPSIVDYLRSLNLDSSFSNRARLAVSYGIVKSPDHYHGTASQNSRLLIKMREAAK